MRVRLLAENGRKPINLDNVTLVVVEDDTGTPVSVASEFGHPDFIAVSHVNDADFYEMLKNLGIRKLVVPEDLTRKLGKGNFQSLLE